MKYKLINKTSSEEHICEKIVIDGWDYYVSDETPKEGERVYHVLDFPNNLKVPTISVSTFGDSGKKVIATNNPSIDISKVVKEVEILAKQNWGNVHRTGVLGFIDGYNKSQETHSFSEEDVIEFLNWIRDNTVFDSAPKPYYRKTQTRLSHKELLQLWKEQKTKTLYYE